MGVYIWAGFTACFLVAQGVSTLLTGRVEGLAVFFRGAPRTIVRVGLARRVFSGLLCIVPGTALVFLLARSASRAHLSAAEILGRVSAKFIDVFGPLTIVWVGVLGMIRPSAILGWVKHSYPEIDVDDPKLASFVKLIGLGLFVVGGIVLMTFAR